MSKCVLENIQLFQCDKNTLGFVCSQLSKLRHQYKNNYGLVSSQLLIDWVICPKCPPTIKFIIFIFFNLLHFNFLYSLVSKVRIKEVNCIILHLLRILKNEPEHRYEKKVKVKSLNQWQKLNKTFVLCIKYNLKNR